MATIICVSVIEFSMDNKPDDTENKDPWLEFGEQKEKIFIEKVSPKIGLNMEENPKKREDPTALDVLVDGEPADIKTQETPFFTAEKNYGLPPQFVVTFNKNDYKRYKTKNSPDVYFWVRWQDELKGYGAKVDKMEGVWVASFETIEQAIKSGDAPCHEYRRRKGDSENANSSYLLDLRNMDRLACFVGSCGQE